MIHFRCLSDWRLLWKSLRWKSALHGHHVWKFIRHTVVPCFLPILFCRHLPNLESRLFVAGICWDHLWCLLMCLPSGKRGMCVTTPVALEHAHVLASVKGLARRMKLATLEWLSQLWLYGYNVLVSFLNIFQALSWRDILLTYLQRLNFDS